MIPNIISLVSELQNIGQNPIWHIFFKSIELAYSVSICCDHKSNPKSFTIYWINGHKLDQWIEENTYRSENIMLLFIALRNKNICIQLYICEV